MRSHPLLAAIDRFTTGLKRFAASKGKAEIYHETITWAYLLLIHDSSPFRTRKVSIAA